MNVPLPHIKVTLKPKETRESWLLRAIPTLRKLIIAAGGPDFPEPLVSVGLPSRGALSSKRRTIGECWTEKCVGDEKRCALFISPTLDDPVKVLDVTVHELVHASVGNKAGHGPAFKKVALGVGLTGPMRATVAGPELKAFLVKLAKELGPFPHSPLKNFRDPGKKQTTRMRLYVCDNCGCKIRKASDTFMALHYCENDVEGETGMFILKDSPNLPED